MIRGLWVRPHGAHSTRVPGRSAQGPMALDGSLVRCSRCSMEPHHSDQPDMELLETDPPGSFERYATAALQRRGVRAAGFVAVALLVGVGVVTGLSEEEPAPAAQAQPASASQRDPDSYEPPPWVTSEEVGWQVLGRPKVSLRSPVYVVKIVAVNRTSEARKPQNLRAVGRFVGFPGFKFSAACTGFDDDAAGNLRPIRSVVQPGEKFLLRCTDAMEYSNNRPDLAPGSIRIQAVPCEHEGRDPSTV